MRKIRERILAAALAAVVLITMPGTASYALEENGRTERISDISTESEEADAAEEPETETDDIRKLETEDNGTEEPKTETGDTEETDSEETTEEESDSISKETTEDTEQEGTGERDVAKVPTVIDEPAEGAVAKVEKEGEVPIYVASLADAFADGNSGATITLLADVMMSNCINILYNRTFTLDLNGHTISCSYTAFRLNAGGNLTIRDSGENGGIATYADSHAVAVLGTLTLEGGHFSTSGDNYNGVNVYNNTVLNVIGEDVYINKLFVDKSQEVTLTAGTYGSITSRNSLDNLLGENCAYYGADGKPLVLEGLGGAESLKTLTGPVTVAECRHDAEGIAQYQRNEDVETHTLTCLACGYTETADCDYSTEYKYDGTTHTQTCTLCGYDKVEAHTFKLAAKANSTVITVSEACVCGYVEELGTVTLTIPENLTYGETKGKEVQWETDLQLNGNRLDFQVDKRALGAYDGPCPLPELSAGEHTLEIGVILDRSKYAQCSIPFTVSTASLTPTITGATTKTYDGTTDVPDGLNIELKGLVDGDDVTAAVTTCEYASADAGVWQITASGITLSGADVGNYELSDNTAQTDGTINKAPGTLTVPDMPISKKYGDADFFLDCSTNGDGTITYTSENEDVATVSADGMVQIRGLGEAMITVSLAEGTNHTGADDRTVTVNVDRGENAPNMPESAMNVSDSCLKVGDVTLPENWDWREEDREKALQDETAVEAVAVYTGADKDNYESVTVTVAVTSHKAGDDILYTGVGEKEPTCTETGLGHRECITCHIVVESGIVAEALGHNYISEITKEPTISEEGEMTYTCSRCGVTYTETIPKEIPKGLWISGLTKSVSYTGSAIKPEGIRVYHGSTLLCEKTEYTLSYKNNTKAGTAQVIVTGKGSYKGKATAEFTIEAVDFSTDTNISAFVATATETGKNLKPAVTVTWNGKKLKGKTDYTLAYDANIKTASTEGYDITISGKGNYTGTIVRKFCVVPGGMLLLNSAKVTGLAKSYPYQEGKEIPEGLEADLEKLAVKIGKTPLIKGTDYTVRVENGNTVGTGTIVIEAAQTGVYAGEKRILFNIAGTNLSKCFITGLEKTYPYTGESVMPEIKVYTGKNATGTQIPSDAYTVRYSNYINQGKATVTVTGIPEKGYSGSAKATYTIGRLDLAAEKTVGSITVTMPDDIKYAKGGAKPQPVITHSYNGTVHALREGVDYTLKYSSNMSKYVSGTSAAAKKPILKITGTGNYSGTITENFDIAAQDIGKLEITVADKAYNSKKKGSYYYSVPKVYDLDGKQLGSGRDYTVQYANAATGNPIGKTDTVENGTQICVIVIAKENSNYEGTLSRTYFVRDAKDVKDISKAKYDKIASQQYTGSEIKPEVSLYTLTGKTKNYLAAEDYEIVGYYNNVKKGTATILIRGINAYSGVKSITFKIAEADNNSIWSGIF